MAFATAPKMATPTALPIDRAKRLVPVTTPRSSQSTLAWAAMSDGVATSPRPRPTMKQDAATTPTDGADANTTSGTVPSTTMAMPMSTVARKPMRR